MKPNKFFTKYFFGGVLPFFVMIIVLEGRLIGLVLNPNKELWRIAIEPFDGYRSWQGAKLLILKSRGADLNYRPKKAKGDTNVLSTLELAVLSGNRGMLLLFCEELLEMHSLPENITVSLLGVIDECNSSKSEVIKTPSAPIEASE